MKYNTHNVLVSAVSKSGLLIRGALWRPSDRSAVAASVEQAEGLSMNFVRETCSPGWRRLREQGSGAVASVTWLQRTCEDSRLKVNPGIAEHSYLILTSPQLPSSASANIVRLLLRWGCWLVLLPLSYPPKVHWWPAYIFTGGAVGQLIPAIPNTVWCLQFAGPLFFVRAPAWCSPTERCVLPCVWSYRALLICFTEDYRRSWQVLKYYKGNKMVCGSGNSVLTSLPANWLNLQKRLLLFEHSGSCHTCLLSSLFVWSAVCAMLAVIDYLFVTEIPLGEQGHWPGGGDASPSWWTERNHGSKHRYPASSCASPAGRVAASRAGGGLSSPDRINWGRRGWGSSEFVSC